MDWGTIWPVAVAAGIPSAVVGLLIRRMEKRQEKREKAREEQTGALVKNNALLVRVVMATLSLSEATTRAVQRIPDAHCNGDMSKALEYARTVKNEYRDFEREQTANHLYGNERS